MNPTPITALHVTALAGLPLFAPGMDLAGEVVQAAHAAGEVLGAGDVLVIAQKIVSKAEGRLVSLASVTPSRDALALAQTTRRPAALCQLILDESRAILRATPHAIIARHTTGHVLANAGIDASNVEGGDDTTVLLWPRDPDASARTIRANIAAISGAKPAVIIADSMGRAWRIGTLGTAIGAAGIHILHDKRGQTDLFGRVLQATIIGVVDSLAAMAVLAMGEGAEGTPAAIIRGANAWITAEDGPGTIAGLRSEAEDMFR